MMNEINNGITDLLDYVIRRKASALYLETGNIPKLAVNSQLEESSFPAIDHDELIEDMLALGIDIENEDFVYYFHSLRNGNTYGEKFSVRISFGMMGYTIFIQPKKTLLDESFLLQERVLRP